MKIRTTLENLKKEYTPLYNLLENITKEEPDTVKKLTETLDKLYKTDEFFINSQEVIELLSELQFQIEDDAIVYSDYTKIFTGKQYLDLMRSMFYFYISKVIQFIKNEFYSSGRTNNISPDGRSVLTLFNQIMRDVVFEKINDVYKLDSQTDGEIQEELDRQRRLIMNAERRHLTEKINQRK